MCYPELTKLPTYSLGKIGWPWTEASPPLPEKMPDGTPWPRISIVTPSYNQGQFLEETIRSVLLQRYPNLEYIIIDGGSTDNSVDIIRKYEPWLAYWVSEPDKGQADAINKGMKYATGEIVAWLNSDDTYLPSALTQVAMIMARSSNAVMVYAKSQLCDVNGHFLKEIGGPFSFEAMLNINNVVPQPSVFIRRSIAQQTGLLRTDLHYVMDWEYWLRLALLGEVRFVEYATWSTYRWYPQSKTARWPLETDIELATVYADFFDYSGLPSDIRKLRSASLWKAYTRCAERYYSQGDASLARQYALHAIQASWQNTLSSQWRNRMISYLFGQTWTEKLINTKTRFAKWFYC